MSDIPEDIWKFQQSANDKTHACNCIGPRNGQPVCPCRMRAVTVENGRYVLKEDLGPVEKAYTQFLDPFGSR